MIHNWCMKHLKAKYGELCNCISCQSERLMEKSRARDEEEKRTRCPW